MKLCVIVLGLVRTFFTGPSENFLKMLDICLEKYTTIHVIFIVSGQDGFTEVREFSEKLTEKNISTELHQFEIEQASDGFARKFSNQSYLDQVSKYTIHKSDAYKEIWDPTAWTKLGALQFFQLKIGIEKMLDYEKNSGIVLDVCMKTRFDTNYPENFYPFVHNKDATYLDKIYFNAENKAFFSTKIPDIKTHIEFLKTNQISLPSCRTEHIDVSFGGSYFSNYLSLENIEGGNDRILYMYNDFFIFGSRTEFIELQYLFDEYGCIETNLIIPHYFAQEAQVLLFCFSRGISPIMYKRLEIDKLLQRAIL